MILPVNLVFEAKAKWRPEQIRNFESRIWPEAARDLARSGIEVQVGETSGEVERPSQRQPVIGGLERRALNIVVTDQIPMFWDHGRALNGVTTLYRGYHLCMIALQWAHGHQWPLLSVNTCLHEMLHALLGDIFESRPKGITGNARELRVDAYATRMWLFGDVGFVRDEARAYVEKLRSA